MRNLILALMLALITSSGLIAQNTVHKGLFDQEELLELTLKMDLSELMDDRGYKPAYHKAKLSWNDEAEEKSSMKVKVKARGNFRLSTCDFPPLLIKFGKSDSLGPFNANVKLKMVTHCQEDKFILREYMVYKTWQQLSDWSLGVRLCKVTYKDQKDKVETTTHYAFMIEDMGSLAARKGGEVPDIKKINWEKINREQLTLVHLFQYMIGNPDHRADELKNTKMIQVKGEEKAYPIPYDFDWAEVVDADYTKLAGTEKNPIFAKRKYVPICRTEEEYEEAFKIFEEKHEAIIQMYEETDLLDDDEKKQSLKYYKEFYRMIRKPGQVKKIFVDSCPDN